jgi:hypothetical protein
MAYHFSPAPAMATLLDDLRRKEYTEGVGNVKPICRDKRWQVNKRPTQEVK